MSTIFIILALIIVFAVVIYIIGIKRGDSQQSFTESKEIPAEPDDEEDDEI